MKGKQQFNIEMIKLFIIIDAFFNKHKGARRLMLFWAMALISFVVISIVLKITTVDEHASNIVMVVVGLLATVIGFYQWSRNQDK